MPRLTHSAARLALAFALFGAPAHTASRVASLDSFDVYIAGVRVAELTVTDDGGSRSFTIRKKDIASNQWRPAVTASESEVARDTAFALPGSIKGVVASIPSLRTIHWSSLRAVGWPDANTIYVRHTDQREDVNGRTVSATRWVQRDASNPMDFVFSDDDQLIAAIDVSYDVVLVRRGYERFTTVGRWNDPLVSQPMYGYRALPQAMVPMSDGVKLATLVYLPDGNISGPFPVVFIRTPYGISMIGEYWPYAARGYALVFQAARGTSFLDPRHKSEGVWQPMINEPKDGADGLAWITKQAWSNGKICMQGASYAAYTQWATTMAGNPALKCIVPESSMGTAFAEGGGTLGEGSAYYIFFMLNQPILPNRTWTEILHHRPLRDLDVFATGKDLPQWNADLGDPDLRRPRASSNHRDIFGRAGGWAPGDSGRPTGRHPAVGSGAEDLSAHWILVIAVLSRLGARHRDDAGDRCRRGDGAAPRHRCTRRRSSGSVHDDRPA
jgi:hypothetical protein